MTFDQANSSGSAHTQAAFIYGASVLEPEMTNVSQKYATSREVGGYYDAQFFEVVLKQYQQQLIWRQAESDALLKGVRTLRSNATTTLLPNWYALAKSSLSERSFGRLQSASRQLDTEGLAAQTFEKAFGLFLRFWAFAKQGSAEPDLFVLPNGRMQALWSHPTGAFLVVEFVGSDKVFWAVNEGANITEGEQAAASIGTLVKNLKALASKPMKWQG